MVLGVVRLIVFAVDTALWIPPIILASLADPHAKLAYHVARAWAWTNVKLCASRVRVEGLEHLDRATSYVFMSNHRSNFDVLALVMALWDFQLRWVAKEELARIPGFGWALRASKQIIINRSDHVQALASLARAKEQLRNGISVVFFPEGTRSGGGMLPFKKGGFVFAIETGAAIVPIAIRGTQRILPRSGWLVRRGGDVDIVVCPPISTTGMTHADRDALLATVERTITDALDRIPDPLGDGASVRAPRAPQPALGGVGSTPASGVSAPLSPVAR